jgi:molecular chaperone GrpE
MEDNREQRTADGAAGTAAQEPPAADPQDLQRQRDEYYDLLLRTTAEFENFRKRTERERQSFADATAADVMQDLLPIVDNLERALSADPGPAGSDSYRRGVELIHQQLLDLLRKRGVQPIEAVGTDFDPHYHEAVLYEPAQGRREGEVIDELRRGYKLGDRLLRASMVKVAKGA